ncbi:unnamed protein product [marine sediment metagenome]|uniref:Uncharacterized protein n=1 Tax=marine sediment metagenome TaxID=412755 RepID=X1LNV2_9ZZZZ
MPPDINKLKSGVAALLIGWVVFIDNHAHQLFVSLTPKPSGYDQHGRPVFISEGQARRLVAKVIGYITKAQGFAPDYICFHELQKNGNHHYHLVMSNINLSLPEFGPIKERCDSKGYKHLCLTGLEIKARDIMGSSCFRLWGGLDANLTASFYLSRDLLKQDRDGQGVEISPHYGKRDRKRKQLSFAMSVWSTRLRTEATIQD